MSKNHFSISALEIGPMANFIYLIIDHKSNQAAVVDPAWDVNRILSTAKAMNVTITDILLTHSHHDHINGIQGILEHCDAKLHLTHAEAKFWNPEFGNPLRHYGGDTITLGNTPIGVLHTPGHTPGSACYQIDNQLLTGDTLFVYGCGRCDLHGGDPNLMYDTLRKLQTELPKNTITLPGHNYSSKPQCTLEEQTESNPFMHYLDDKDKFVNFRMHVHDRLRGEPLQPVKPEEMSQFE